VFEVVRALADHGAAQGIPTVVLYGRRPETPAAVSSHFHERVRTVEVPGWGVRRLVRSLTASIRAAGVLRAELAAYTGGVIHLHSSYAGIVGRLAAPRRGWKLFYSPHAYAFLNDALPAPARGFARVSEAVLGRRGKTIAVSRAEGAVAAQIVGRRRVIVVPNGVDLPPLRETVSPAGPFLVASMGRASFQRRPDLFAEVAGVLRDQIDAEFVWLGDGPDRARLEQAGVRVSGWLPRPDAHNVIERAHVVLHLSAFEGLPFALLEAMARSKAIVASDLPPIRETLGQTGLVVRTSREACSALRRLHESATLRETLGRNARTRVEHLFTREQMVQRTLSAYGL
jgi:glycosyltransferase involved in cell wall biosynthesis